MRDVWAVSMGELCLGGHTGHQGSAMGGQCMEGPCGGKFGPPALSPRASGPPALSPVSCRCQGHPPNRAPRGGNGFGARMGTRGATALPAATDANPAQTQPLPHGERAENVPGRGGQCPEPRFWYQPVTGTHCFGHLWVWCPPGGIAGARVAPT